MEELQGNGDPTGGTSSPPVNYNRSRRRSSIFPQYLRRKSKRKDSTFASESTTTLWPFAVEEKQPSLFDYQPGGGLSGANLGLKFGWVNGVYIRTVLNIWGVMLFLRMGWITGHAGIVASLVIVLVSTLVTVCTTLSMSAICTNGEVGTGGIYYMISRSLGAEAGAMIGVIFSFANAVLVSLNLVGAAETTVEILAIFDKSMIDPTNDARIYGAVLLVLVAIIPLIGMDWEAKAMFVLMMILLVGIANYLVGTFLPLSDKKIAEGMLGWSGQVIGANLWPKFEEAGFAEVFAVFFPSVIGIFAGASMSGDLRNPNEAIPKGTFLAILTTSSTYALLIIFLGFTVLPYASGNFEEMSNLTDVLEISCRANRSCRYGLTNDYQTMAMSSAFGPLIYAGIYAATISSALGSYVCSPRIFQALCEDKLFPYIHYFAKGYGKGNDPRRGYVLTFIIALVFISIGELNLIAPIISNFFMACFCLVNIACFHSSFVGSPSFRPTFKYYNQWVSLLTGLACVGIMFFLDWISAIVTVLIMGGLYLYISKKRPDVNWGSSTRSHVYNNALSSALKLNFGRDHIKNFRPSILLLTGNPSARIPLVEFANNITRNRSLLMIGHITNYEIVQEVREKVINAQYEWMAKRKIKAFYLLLEASSLASGAKAMLQVSGLGRKLAPSIIMLGYKSSWRDCLVEDLLDYYSVMLKAMDMYTGICILRVQEGLDYADFFGPVFHRSRQSEEADTYHDELPEPVSPSNHKNHSPQPSPSPTATTIAIEEVTLPPPQEVEGGGGGGGGYSSKASTPSVGTPKVRFDRVVSFNVEDENNNNITNNHHQHNGGVLLSPVAAAAAAAQTPQTPPNSALANHSPSALRHRPPPLLPLPPVMFTFTNTSHLPKAVDRKMENMKALIPHDALDAINQFNDKQKEGPIDIWWLSEDGGLTILLPYMLKNSTFWSHCAIRVFCLAKTEDQIEGIRSNMIELLDRLRIPYADVLVYSQDELEPSDHTVGRFRHFIGSFLSKSEAVAGRSAKLSKSELGKFEAMTSRYMKIRDLLVTHSRLSTLIVMTLPKPHKDIPASLFMSWCETITEDMPPFLFVRGHKHVPSIAI